MPAVNSGRRVRLSPPRSSKLYISLETMSVVSPIERAKTGGALEHRHLDPAEAVEPAHALERRDHRLEAVGVLAPDVLGASDLLRALAHRRGLSIFDGRGEGVDAGRDARIADGARHRESPMRIASAFLAPPPRRQRRRLAAARQLHPRRAGRPRRLDPAGPRRPLSRHDPPQGRRDRRPAPHLPGPPDHPGAEGRRLRPALSRMAARRPFAARRGQERRRPQDQRRRPAAAPGGATRPTSTPSTSTSPRA